MRAGILGSALMVVGPGRAGRAFARSWIGAGGRAPEIVGRDSASAREGAASIRGGNPRAIDELTPSSPIDLVVVAVPDDAIASVAAKLAGRVRPRFAFHLSGALPSEALAAFREGGASLGSLHPLRAFSGAESESWRDAFVAIEGDPEAVAGASELVAAIGGRAFPLPAGAKALYHAGATLAAGGTVALLSMAVRAWVQAGLPESEARQALIDLSTEAARALEGRDFAEAFTGAVARRDLGTVRAHVEALTRLPEVARVYRELALETLARTPGRGLEEEIRRILEPVKR